MIIVTPPTQWQMPLLNANEEQEPKGCEPPKCFQGYSGSDFGTPRYLPKPNLGYYYVSFHIVSYSARSIECKIVFEGGRSFLSLCLDDVVC